MDSQYVYDGLKGLAFCWRASGWVGQSGPVCNVDLWVALRDQVARITPTVRWLEGFLATWAYQEMKGQTDWQRNEG